MSRLKQSKTVKMLDQPNMTDDIHILIVESSVGFALCAIRDTTLLEKNIQLPYLIVIEIKAISISMNGYN